MPAALQVWSHTFSKAFDALPKDVQEAVGNKVDELGRRLANYSHQRLQGRSECKLRVGDYRVLYEPDVHGERLFLHYVGHRREIYNRK